MKQKIIFIVDGNTAIGLGHVYRSLNLAKEIKKELIQILKAEGINNIKDAIGKGL